MATVELLNQLWAGKLSKCEFDFSAHLCVLTVELLDSGTRKTFKLEARGLRTFSMVYEPDYALRESEPWDYMELSSILATKIHIGDKNFWKLEGELWEDPSRLSLVCNQISLNGDLLEES